MGLCCVCAGKTGLLFRKRLGDGSEICGSCQRLISDGILENASLLTKGEVKSWLDYSSKTQSLTEIFRESHHYGTLHLDFKNALVCLCPPGLIDKTGRLKGNPGDIYRILDIICNIIRSIPFLILLILLIPFTRAVVGKSYGSTATIVPLVICCAPYIARMVESSLKEVDPGVIEAARSMGASNGQIILHVLLVEARTSLLTGATITTGLVLGYSAMSGTVGGGGLGDIAVRYGYYRWQTDIMIVTVILLVVLFQIIQNLGMKISEGLDRRK